MNEIGGERKEWMDGWEVKRREEQMRDGRECMGEVKRHVCLM